MAASSGASAAAKASLPVVSLDLGNRNGSWDDRELLNAYDAALLEFHIHNPGPGSWLDKATAALAKGQPLPGANAFGTEWYSAAKRQVDGNAAKAEAGAAKSTDAKKFESAEPSRKKQRTAATRKPYSPSVAVNSPLSPTYTPPSPGEVEGSGVGEGDEYEGTAGDEHESAAGGEYDGASGQYYEDAEAEEAEAEDYDDPAPEWDGHIENYPSTSGGWGTTAAAAAAPAEQFFPPPSGGWQPAAAVTRDEAIGYALHAQYWAGYWMGVARGAGRGQVGPGGGGRRRAGGTAGADGGAGQGARWPTRGNGTPAWASNGRRKANGAGTGGGNGGNASLRR